MEIDKSLIKSWESVSKTIDPEHPDRIVFKFGTYGWSFPSQFKDGMHKNGITKEIENPGTKRMTEACSGKKTAIPEEPFVIQNSEIIWTIPFEISNGLLTEANKFARKFDIECNKALAKYKVKLPDQKMVGEEWYRLSVPEVTKIRNSVWKKLIGRELTKKEQEAKKVRTKIQLKKGLQEKAHQAVLDELKKGTERFKGIAPTGFGKTVLAWKIFTDAYVQGLIKGKVSIMTAPSQFLCNKNSVAFDTYNGINGITGIVNQPIFSGQDVGVFENENEFNERKVRLEKQLEGHLKAGNRVILHVCINSMKLVDEVLEALNVPALDLMIVDEAHTLASHRDNNDKTYLGTVRNFCLFDENIKVSHRFFLTATEKNLVNPEILTGDQIFAYMNNESYFGGYAFKYSYAECVVDGLIVPFRCKVFEYSDVTKDVVKMMKMGIDRFLLEDLALRDNEGDIGQVSTNLIRVLVSSLKVIQERNKMLLIVSRNSHADLLEKAFELLQQDPNYAFLTEVNINKITTLLYPKPASRQDELEIIHESDEKHIIICGPWAITGTDCPSIDAVLWGFLPGTEISAAQGTGRGTRTHSGKNDLLVAFNLDLNSGLADLKNNLIRTVAKLHEGLFPKHDLELSYKVKKILGRSFNETEKDKEAVIKPEVRKLLDDFYEAATETQLFDFVNSSAFLNGGRSLYEDFELFKKITLLLYEFEKEGISYLYAQKKISSLCNPYCKLLKKDLGKHDGKRNRQLVENPDYDQSLWPCDITPLETYKDIMIKYEIIFGNPWRNLKKYASEDDFIKTLKKYGITTRNQYFDSYYKDEFNEEFIKMGMPAPSSISSGSVYTEEFIDKNLSRVKKYHDLTYEEAKVLYDRIVKEIKTFKFVENGGYLKIAKELGMASPTALKRILYDKYKFQEISIKIEDHLDIRLIAGMLESGGHTQETVASYFGVNSKIINRMVKKFEANGGKINYIPRFQSDKPNKKLNIDKNSVIEMKRNGLDALEIAQKHNCSTTSIARILKDARSSGILNDLKKQPGIEEIVNKIDVEGHTWNSAAKELDMNPNTLQRHYKNYKESLSLS